MKEERGKKEEKKGKDRGRADSIGQFSNASSDSYDFRKIFIFVSDGCLTILIYEEKTVLNSSCLLKGFSLFFSKT